MIVLRAADAGKERFLLVRFQVAVFVGEDLHLVIGRYDDTVAEDADAVHGVDVPTLVEDRLFVRLAVAVGIFEHQNAVPFGPAAVELAVVLYLGRPDTAQVVDVDVGDIGNLRLTGKKRGLQARGDVEPGDRIGRFARNVAPRGDCGSSRGRLE